MGRRLKSLLSGGAVTQHRADASIGLDPRLLNFLASAYLTYLACVHCADALSRYDPLEKKPWCVTPDRHTYHSHGLLYLCFSYCGHTYVSANILL